MTTPEMFRCKKCNLCHINDENGKWICTECDKDIHEITDEESGDDEDEYEKYCRIGFN
jgi:hypothetical protein